MEIKWYILAISCAFSIFTKMFEPLLMSGFLLLLLIYWFYKQIINMITFISALIIYMFFIIYLPTIEDVIKLRDHVDKEQTEFVGKINGSVIQKDNYLRFKFKEHETNYLYEVVSFNNDENTHHFYSYGNVCKIKGIIERPSFATNPLEFDYEDYLLKQKVIYQIKVIHESDIFCKTKKSLLEQIDYFAINWKEKLNNIYSNRTNAWIKALVFGDRNLLEEDTIKLFQRWGLSHILAISGFHVGMIVIFIYFILKSLRTVTKETIQTILIFLLPIYMFITGLSPSVIRASLMVVLLLTFQKLHIRISHIDLISIVFLLLVFINKMIIYDIGFQFSFLVTFSIIVSSKWLSNKENKFHQGLIISFVSQMIILPLQIYYFQTFNPLSIIINVIVIPFFSLIIPFVFILSILYFFPKAILAYADSMFNKLMSYFDFVLQFADKHFYYPLKIGTFPLLYVFIYYILLSLLFIYCEKNLKYKAFVFGMKITCLLIILTIRPYFNPNGYVTFLDIGQGDAILIELPYRKGVFMIDAGATFMYEQENDVEFLISSTQYDQVIEKELNGKSIYSLDAIFLSHNHIDHVGSYQFIKENFTIKHTFISKYSDWIEEKDIKHVKAGDKINIGNSDFYVLGPIKDYGDENSNSLVLYVEFEDVSYLFTGDMTVESEKDLIQKYPSLKVDVLKVAHHGSHTSTSEQLIKHIKPKCAIIPVGENNRYQHPNQDVINRLRENKIKVYRTDEDGAVILSFRKNRGAKVSTYKNKKVR